MRDIFRRLLKDLKRLTGLNQYQTLQDLPDDKFREEVTALLDILCRVADQYPMIPDADKEKIIEAGMINDPDFTGMNAKVISRWLNQHKEKYTAMQAKATSEKAAGRVLTPDEYAPYLEQWLADVKKIGNTEVTPEAKISDLRKRFYGKDVDGPAIHPSTTIEEYEARELRLEQAKAKRMDELRTKHPTLTIDELNRLL